MRLFVGIDIDEAIRERIADYVARLKTRVDAKFVRPASYHITLKFLGETGKRAEIAEALRGISVPGFEIALRGTGFFPNARQPRIFWAGIEAGPELRELASQTSKAMARLGFAEEGTFKPHLSLARSGSGNPHGKAGRDAPALGRIAQLIASEPMPEFGTMSAREFFLFESKLKPTGAEYHKLEKFELASR